MNWRGPAQTLVITLAALVTSLTLFAFFIQVYAGVSPARLYYWMYRGSFGTKFSIQYTLTNAAPLILTALCTALPARLGLVVIGGEGALVFGGLAAASVGLLFAGMPAPGIQVSMALAGMLAGRPLITPLRLLPGRPRGHQTHPHP